MKLDDEPPRKPPFPRWTFVLEKWGCIVMALIAAAVIVFIVAMYARLRSLGSSWGE